MAVFNNQLAGAAGQGGADAAYQIERSLRFDENATAFLERTPSSSSNLRTFTWSGWVKRSSEGYNFLLLAYQASPYLDTGIAFNPTDQLYFYNYDSGGWNGQVTTDAVFRDYSAWYHVVVVYDTTDATPVKFYVNGEQQSTSGTQPTSNSQSAVNNTVSHKIGRYEGSTTLSLDGYLADVHLIDGQALDPTDFGEYDDNNVWQPKEFTGTYGTNGWRLRFNDTTALGNDSSGNNNDWRPYNFSTATGGPTSVAAASGALPIYNTTGTYGTTQGSGVRPDSFVSDLVACFPLADSSGLVTTDESPSGRTSSTKTISSSTSVSHSSSVSKFYGGSANMTASTSKIDFGDSNDFSHLGNAITFEGWFYLTSSSGSSQYLFSKHDTNTGTSRIYEFAVLVDSSGNLGVVSSPDGTQPSGNWNIQNAAAFPLNQWNHVAFVIDGTGSSPVSHIYLNGILEKSGGSTYLPSNTLNTASPLVLGNPNNSSASFVGYVQDFRVYKGSSPKYTGNFSPPTSTQDNTIAPENDSLIDTPTNYSASSGNNGGNYCTLNPLAIGTGASLSDGNLTYSMPTATYNATALSTIGMSSGKWYCEYVLTAGSYAEPGIATAAANLNYHLGQGPYSWMYLNLDGSKWNNSSSSSYGSSYGIGDVIGIAFDADNGNLTFYKNGVSQGVAFTGLTSGPYFYAVGAHSQTAVFNFGQRQFAYPPGSSGGPSSDYKSLCTTNLPDPTIKDGSTAMDIVLYASNATARTFSGLNLSPDLIWSKRRSSAARHVISDSVRGTNKEIFPNLTDTERTSTDGLTAFNSDGYTIGADSQQYGWQSNGQTFVNWLWDAGSTTATNNNGDIQSTVRANQSAGISIVTYSGTLSNTPSPAPTVGHGLNTKPALIISKSRSPNGFDGGNWFVNHSYNYANAFRLNLTNSEASIASGGGGTAVAPTTSVFSTYFYSGSNCTNNNYVAYCFAPVSQFSSFGVYSGNGLSEGPFVHTGFRIRWLMVKRTDSADSWQILDTARSPYNVAEHPLYADLSNYEVANTSRRIDLLSNGFRLRGNNVGINASGGTYIYAAFAEHPFSLNGGLAR